MPSLEEMRGLGQEIVASHRSRKGAIVSLKGETRNQLAGYRSEHRAMGKEVRAELAKAKAQLEAETNALMKELAEGSKARQMGLRIQLTGFHKDHQAMAKELHPRLKADNAALMKELGEVDAARQAEVNGQLREYQVEMQAARTGWQEGLGAAPSRPKPRPSAPPKARSKSRRPPTG